MIYRYSSGQNYSDTSNFYLQLQNLNLLLSPKKYHVPFFFMNIPKENPFRQLDKQLVLCLQCIIVIHIMFNRVLYMILILPRHCLIYDPDSSPSLSYIWSWFFPITVLYMILILPRHCIIYDPDSSPSVPYLHEERSYKYLFNLTLFLKFRRSGRFTYLYSSCRTK